MGDDSRVVDPGQAPTPFTAAEIRTGCSEGRAVTIRYVDSNRLVTYWTTTFTECDETGTMLVDQEIDEQGKPIGETSRVRASWDELQAHASFPGEQTTISREIMATPLGELDCLRTRSTTGRASGFYGSQPTFPAYRSRPRKARARVHVFHPRSS